MGNEKTRFKPGKSGNPNGRPKGAKSSTSIWGKMLDRIEKGIDPLSGAPAKITIRDVMLANVLLKAKAGDLKAVEMILDRTEGKLTQPVDNQGPLVIKVE